MQNAVIHTMQWSNDNTSQTKTDKKFFGPRPVQVAQQLLVQTDGRMDGRRTSARIFQSRTSNKRNEEKEMRSLWFVQFLIRQRFHWTQ